MRNRGLCCRLVSVRLSSVLLSFRHVRVLYPHEKRYGQTSLSAGSPIILVFDPERWVPIPRGTPSAGAQNTRGWGKFAIFDRNHCFSRKRYETGPWLL